MTQNFHNLLFHSLQKPNTYSLIDNDFQMPRDDARKSYPIFGSLVDFGSSMRGKESRCPTEPISCSYHNWTSLGHPHPYPTNPHYRLIIIIIFYYDIRAQGLGVNPPRGKNINLLLFDPPPPRPTTRTRPFRRLPKCMIFD